MLKVAILNDYARTAPQLGDFSSLKDLAELTVFEHAMDEDDAVKTLQPFDMLCVFRDRTIFTNSLLERLPNLKVISYIAIPPASLDVDAATRLGIALSAGCDPFASDRYKNVPEGAPEVAWGLILAATKNLVIEDRNVRAGGWTSRSGMILHGRTLGLLGLGRIGKRLACFGKAFGMNVISWSQNLTEQAAAAEGVRRVEKDEVFTNSDVVAICLKLSDRTRGLVGAREFALMKPTSYLMNISRGPIVDEAAMLAALNDGTIAGAGLDVYDIEPLPKDHPLRTMENVVLAPHLGFANVESMGAYYLDHVEGVAAYAKGEPVRILNPEALEHPRHQWLKRRT